MRKNLASLLSGVLSIFVVGWYMGRNDALSNMKSTESFGIIESTGPRPVVVPVVNSSVVKHSATSMTSTLLFPHVNAYSNVVIDKFLSSIGRDLKLDSAWTISSFLDTPMALRTGHDYISGGYTFGFHVLLDCPVQYVVGVHPPLTLASERMWALNDFKKGKNSDWKVILGPSNPMVRLVCGGLEDTMWATDTVRMDAMLLCAKQTLRKNIDVILILDNGWAHVQSMVMMREMLGLSEGELWRYWNELKAARLQHEPSVPAPIGIIHAVESTNTLDAQLFEFALELHNERLAAVRARDPGFDEECVRLAPPHIPPPQQGGEGGEGEGEGGGGEGEEEGGGRRRRRAEEAADAVVALVQVGEGVRSVAAAAGGGETEAGAAGPTAATGGGGAAAGSTAAAGGGGGSAVRRSERTATRRWLRRNERALVSASSPPMSPEDRDTLRESVMVTTRSPLPLSDYLSRDRFSLKLAPLNSDVITDPIDGAASRVVEDIVMSHPVTLNINPNQTAGYVVMFARSRKTATSTIADVLMAVLGGLRHEIVYHDDAVVNYLSSSANTRSQYRYIHGHYQYGVHVLQDRPARYVYTMRDPFATVASYVPYMLKKTLSVATSKLVPQNFQATFACGYRMALAGADWPFDEKVRWRLVLECAKESLLRRIDVGMVAEEMDLSMVMLQRVLGFPASFIEGYSIANVNPVSKTSVDEMSRELYEAILNHNAMDVELHEFGLALIRDRYRRFETEIHSELETVEGTEHAAYCLRNRDAEC